MTTMDAISDKVLSGQRLSFDDGVFLFRSAGLHELAGLATSVRERKHGRNAFYVVNGHINYTNYCAILCKFCSFCRKKRSRKQDGGYELTVDEIVVGAGEFHAAGVKELHIVGGLHPDFPFQYYIDVISGIRERHPDVGIKAFTAIEIHHLSRIGKLPPRDVLTRLKAAGLDALTGGGAEILVDSIRKKLCPRKETSAEYLVLHGIAHELGIPSTCTMLFGHVESVEHRVEHLIKLREQQDKSKGFLAFVPLAYHPANNSLKYGKGPTGIDALRTVAISRLMLDNIPHVKAYWISLGVNLAQVALGYGADDFDGTVGEEKIHHAAGSPEPRGLPVSRLCHLIAETGYTAVERDCLYGPIHR